MRSIILIFFLMFAALPAMLVFALDEQDKPEGPIHAEWPKIDFNTAYNDFNKREFAAASQEIRKGADFLKAAAERSSGKIRGDLLSVHVELEKLAADTEKNKIGSSLSLQKAFASAHNALAEYYHERLKESWLKKDTDKAGEELKSAVSNLERAIAWAGGGIEEKTGKVIKESRKLGERLTQKAEWTTEEVERTISEVGEELSELEDRIAENTRTNKR